MEGERAFVDPRLEAFAMAAFRTSNALRSSGRRKAIKISGPLSPAGTIGPPVPTELRIEGEGYTILEELARKGAMSYRTGIYPSMLEGVPNPRKFLEKLKRRGLVEARKDRTGRYRYYLNKKKLAGLGLLGT